MSWACRYLPESSHAEHRIRCSGCLGCAARGRVLDGGPRIRPARGDGRRLGGVGPGEGAGAQLSLGLSETPVQEHPRIHLDLYALDLYAGDAADQAAEVERLVSLGAQRVDWDLYPDDADFVVLADPDGNRFCVVDTGRG
jgi:glyoxalase superfamily protein